MIRIMVVDDEQSILELYTLMLRAPVYHLTLVDSGEEAISRYAEAQASGTVFDLVVIDLTLKWGIDGYETLQKILEIDPCAQTLVSSGSIDMSLRKTYQEYGFIDILPKPFSRKELVALIHSILAPKS